MDKWFNEKYQKTLVSLTLMMLPTSFLMAQGSGGSNLLNICLVALAGILFLIAVMTIADNMLQIEGNKTKGYKGKSSLAIFPNFSEFGGKSDFVNEEGESFHTLRKGFDILLEGSADDVVDEAAVSRFAVQPPNFRGIAPIPKVTVEVGDDVQAGDALFYDKQRPDVKFVAPVSGEVVDVVRGAKRSIAEVVLLADKEIRYKALPEIDVEQDTR